MKNKKYFYSYPDLLYLLLANFFIALSVILPDSDLGYICSFIYTGIVEYGVYKFFFLWLFSFLLFVVLYYFAKKKKESKKETFFYSSLLILMGLFVLIFPINQLIEGGVKEWDFYINLLGGGLFIFVGIFEILKKLRT